MVLPCSDRVSRAPPYSRPSGDITHKGLSPTMVRLSRLFCLFSRRHWPVPRSLATTSRISVDVFSSGYLDVSVPRVCLMHLCIQCMILIRGGCPIRKSTDQGVLTTPRGLSQCVTSFIAFWCQGIHQVPFSFSHHMHSNQSHIIPCDHSHRNPNDGTEHIMSVTSFSPSEYSLQCSVGNKETSPTKRSDNPLQRTQTAHQPIHSSKTGYFSQTI